MKKSTILSLLLVFMAMGSAFAQHTRTEPYTIHDDQSKQAMYANQNDLDQLNSEQLYLKLDEALDQSSYWPLSGFEFSGDPIMDAAAYAEAKMAWRERNPNYVPGVGTLTIQNAQEATIQPSTMLNVDR